MRVLFVLSALMVLPVVVYATPPKNVELSVDLKANSVHIHAEHVSERLEKHYIRKMLVSINDVAMEPFYYHRQAIPAGLEVDVPVKLKPNDRIHVELFCSKGGASAADLTIAQPPEDPSVEK